MKNRNSIMLENYEDFISFTLVSMERPVAKPMSSNQNLRVSWKPVNPQDCVLLDVQETNFSFTQFNRIRNHLDTGLRLDAVPTLDLWDLIVTVLENTNQNRIERGDPLLNKRESCSPSHTIHKRK